jgi:RasGEF domain
MDALDAEPIARLTMTWELVNLNSFNVLQSLKGCFMSSNRDTYKSVLKQVRGPCIPLLDLFLAELCALKESKVLVMESGNLNFASLVLISKILLETGSLSSLYVLNVVPEIKNFIETETAANQLTHDELMWSSRFLEK